MASSVGAADIKKISYSEQLYVNNLEIFNEIHRNL